LNDGFVAAVTWGFPFALLIIVVLVATSVAVNSSSLSLLVALFFLIGLGAMVFGLSLGSLDKTLSKVLLCAVIGAGVDLLSGSHVGVEAAVGLKKLVIGEFLPVFVLICFLVCCEWLLEMLWLVIVGERIVVVVFSSHWGNVMVNVAPMGLAT